MKVKLSDIDALIVVDMQNDFMPYGVLPVPEADKIVPIINRYIERFENRGLSVFLTRDWHPKDHISFKGYGGVWPPHCIAQTKGADFHPDLRIPVDNKFIISKGTSKDFDAYSGFQGTILESLLKERGIKRVFICGVATDFCVKNTLIGAINLGFKAFLLEDAVKGVFEDASKQAVDFMLTKGAVLINYDEISI